MTMKTVGLTVLFTLFVPTIVLAQQEAGTWFTRTPMPTPRQEMPHVLLNGEVYVLGGIDSNRLSTDIVEAYNPATNSWSEKASLPPATHHIAAAAALGKLYVIGGYVFGFSATDRVYEYDPTADSWTEKTPMPAPRGALVAASVNDMIYVIGGQGSGATFNTNMMYNPATDTWETRAPMPTAREHLAAAVLDGKIYVVGGRFVEDGALTNLATVEAYDPVADTWDTSIAPIPQSSGGLAAASLNGRLYAFGGEFFSGTSGVYEMNAEYDPTTNTWQDLAPMPLPRHGMGAVAVGDTLFVIGGGVQAGFSTSDVNAAFVPPVTSATSAEKALSPTHVQLEANYPNPFTSNTTVHFSLTQPVVVNCGVYDLQGQLLESLMNNALPAGNHEVSWDAADHPAGLYFVRLQAGLEVFTQPVIKL